MKDKISIRLAGDSGDGIQLIGNQLTFMCAENGWEVQTEPDFPAEIRAPQGTVAGVSGFQLSTASDTLYASEDQVDILVVFNPAALMKTLPLLKEGGLLIYNSDQFQTKDFKKAGEEQQSIEDLIPQSCICYGIEINKQTIDALSEYKQSHSDKKKAKNFYALGLIHWLLQIPIDSSLQLINTKFKARAGLISINQTALKAGYNYALTVELPHFFEKTNIARKATTKRTDYISGTKAAVLALAYVTLKTRLTMLVAGYPITPASNILHEAAKMSDLGIELFQAEDEIAAACAAIGASYGGNLAMTCTSGPGLDLKSESLGFAVMAELPLVVINVQRSGPSTGLPTKTEQTDLMMAIYGRHGEAPLPVLAATSPSDTFYTIIEAFRIAILSMTPVIVLLDAQIVNSTEKWNIPDFNALDFQEIKYGDSEQKPFERLPNLARPWIRPGTPNAMHRLGGLEKGGVMGSVSYLPTDHQKMTEIRQNKINRIQVNEPWKFIEAKNSTILLISWGSTYGVVREVRSQLISEGLNISMLHLKQLYPLQEALSKILKRFQQIYVIELNQGQLRQLIRSKFLINAQGINKTSGQPFRIAELKNSIKEAL